MGLPVPQERVANALVDGVDRGFTGHRAIVSEEGAAPVRMTGNGQEQSLGVLSQVTTSGCVQPPRFGQPAPSPRSHLKEGIARHQDLLPYKYAQSMA